MSIIKTFARKLWVVVTEDDHVVYVIGSGLVPVPNARLYGIPNVIAEHHKDNAERDLLDALTSTKRA